MTPRDNSGFQNRPTEELQPGMDTAVLGSRVEDPFDVKLRQLVELAGDIIWTADMAMRPTYVSNSIQRHLGYTPQEAMQLTMEQVFASHSYQLAMGTLAEEVARDHEPGVEDDRTRTLEVDLVHKDGHLVPVEICYSALRDAHGQITQVMAIARNITERKRAQQALEESESRYRGLFERSLDMVIVIDLEGRIIDANPATARLSGYPLDRLIGRHAWECFTEEERLVAIDMLSTMVRTEQAPCLVEFHPRRKNGRVLDVEVNASLVYHEGTLVGVELISRDITERKQRERERAQAVVRLNRVMAATIEAMSAAVEMRDPYTASHQRRVTRVARAIAEEMGLSDESQQALSVAGALHDLGKISIPAEILAKPGQVTDAEFQLIKEHPEASYNLLKSIRFPWPVAEIVFQHHERLDGSGYPQGLKGDEMLPEARVLAVADVFEAMSSHRPYRPALGTAAALEELEHGRGTLYNPEAVDACIRLVRDKGFTLE